MQELHKTLLWSFGWSFYSHQNGKSWHAHKEHGGNFMGHVEWNSVDDFNGKEAWASKENISISTMVTTREDGDEDTWVLLFTIAIEEGVYGHRYGDTLLLSLSIFI